MRSGPIKGYVARVSCMYFHQQSRAERTELAESDEMNSLSCRERKQVIIKHNSDIIQKLCRVRVIFLVNNLLLNYIIPPANFKQFYLA